MQNLASDPEAPVSVLQVQRSEADPASSGFAGDIPDSSTLLSKPVGETSNFWASLKKLGSS